MKKAELTALVVRGLLLGASALMPATVSMAANPPPSQVYYVPYPENDQLAGFQGVTTDATDPMAVYITFSCAADSTVVYYDHWEDGYEVDITEPAQATTEVYGDGNPANGYPPGNPSDLIPAGTVFSLRNILDSTTLQSVLDYDARDKVASHRPISITKTAFTTSVRTLLAGCVEIFEYGLWGTEYRTPVGVDMPNSTPTSRLTNDANMFDYTALSVMAGPGGATVQIDADNNGAYELTVALDEGETRYVTAANTGAHILADRPVQVVMFTGEPSSDYGSRDTSLLPVNRWSTSYYCPVSTRLGDGTVVFLYNPGATAITVSYDYRNSASSYAPATVNVPANGNARVVLSPYNGSTHFGAYRFYTTGATPPLFYAFAATDADGTAGNNRNWDGGFTLVGQPSLTTQVLLSLGIGRDPTSLTNLTENGNPVWVTTAGNGNAPETVYVDYNGDNAGPLTDVNSNHYDVAYNLRELVQQQVFDPDGDQSGMLLYTLNPNVRLAAMWAQDPTIAAIAQPGLDVATLIPPLREGDAAKNSSLAVDSDGDGFKGPGDALDYNILVINTARSPIPGPFTVTDPLPTNTTYVPGSTRYRLSVGGLWLDWVDVPDNSSGTAYPLDGPGVAIPGNLNVGQRIELVFSATVAAYPDLDGATKIINSGTVVVSPFGITIPLYWEDPLHGSIGDRVWKDTNGDGVQDPGEDGLNGVVVYADLDSDGVRDAGEPWDTTSGDGDYLLTGLRAGAYLVRVDPVTVAALDPRYGVTYDLDGIATAFRASVPLAGGEDRRDADFGFRIGASFGDRVWLDADGDGEQDSGEPGIPGVRVYIDADNDNAYDAWETNVVTGVNGIYYIGNLNPGTVTARVDTASLPAGLTQTYDRTSPYTDHEGSVTLVSAEHQSDMDFGYRGSLSIGDVVWQDPDADGATQLPVINGRVDINGNGAVTGGDDGFIGAMRVVNGYLDLDNDASTSTPDGGDDGTFQGFTVIDGAIDYDGDGSVTAADDGNRLFLPNLAVYNGFVDINASGAADASDNGWIGGVRVFSGSLDVNGDGTADNDDDGVYGVYQVLNGEIDINRSGGISNADDGTLYMDRPLSGVRVYIDANGNGSYDAASELAATTDADGGYTISNLYNGTFVVRVDTSTLPSGVVQTHDLTSPTTDHTASVTLSGSSRTDVDFGYRGGASLGDRVWLDLDADGAQDIGEPGIAGVMVYIDINGNNTFDGGAENFDYTDLNGNYLIGGLLAGTHIVRVDFSTLPAGTTATYDLDGVGTLHEALRALAPSENATNVDFGYRASARFGDRVWNDADADGVQDGGETGIANVRVYADMNGNGAYDVTNEPSALTGAGGYYAISNLLAGTYTARVIPATLPAGLVQTYDLEAPLDHAATFSLAATQNRTDVDFGYVQPAALGDFVWDDRNGNGQQDVGEAGLDGVSVTLYRASDNAIVATTTTRGDGAYRFDGLFPGSYYVGFAGAPGYARTVADQGADESDSDANALTGRSPTVTLAGGSINNTLDAGYYRPATVGNRVWLDENSDGYQDAGEPGLANVGVDLYDGAGARVDSAVTDTRGGYLFTGLAPGTYYVDVRDGTGGQPNTLPFAGLSQTPPSTLAGGDGGNQDHATTAIPSTAHTGLRVDVLGGEESLVSDFGYNLNPSTDVNDNTGSGAIGDRVWVDTDGDGIQDDGEAGVSGVTLTLYTAGADGLFGTADDAVEATTQTDATGRYVFDGLAPDAYVVAITNSTGASHDVLSAGYTQTGDPDDYGSPAADPDSRTTVPVLIGPGDVFVNADFGYDNTGAALGTLGDRVWLDADADGIQDGGERGIRGVTVALVRDLDNDGVRDDGEPVIATAATDSDGYYLFSGLPIADGTGGDDYLVVVTDTDNVLDGKQAVFDLDGDAGSGGAEQADSILGMSRQADLGTAAVLTHDFGYTPAGQTIGGGLIGDTIWLDNGQGGGTSGDGVQNGTEPGIEGVWVELYDETGTALLRTTRTDLNGWYAFGGLDALAAYRVKVAVTNLGSGGVLAGLSNTGDPDGGADGLSDVDLATSGGMNLDQDFGYVGTGNIGNLVWDDRNADGNVDAGEPGLAGVTVDLYRDLDGDGLIGPGEPRLARTTTAADGSYAFAGLATDDGDGDADYVVDVTDAAGVLAGWWHSLGTPGANDNSQADPAAVALTPASPSNTTADFGYYVRPAAVGNRVWLDLDDDGTQETGEPGIANVGVVLTIRYANGTTNVVRGLTGVGGYYVFGNLLLDEDDDGLGGGSEPAYTLSSPVPAGYQAARVDASGSDWTDSDSHSGVAALPSKGVDSLPTGLEPASESASASYDFGLRQPPTLAVVSDFRAVSREGAVFVRWETAMEIGTVGFWLDRKTADGWTRVTAELTVSTDGVYEAMDRGAVAGATCTYRLIELDNRGARILHGPYVVTVDGRGYTYEDWASEAFAGSAADPARGADPDGDGLTNLQEYLAGTAPLDGNSLLRIREARAVRGGVALRWSSSEGLVYSVALSTNLGSGFVPVAAGLPATPPVNTYVCPVNGRRTPMYFRVIVSEP